MSIWVALQVKQDKHNATQKQLFHTSGVHVHYLHTSSTNRETKIAPAISWDGMNHNKRVICDHHNVLGTTNRWQSCKKETLLLHVRDVPLNRQNEKAMGDLFLSD